jgi:hypothetical protein
MNSSRQRGNEFRLAPRSPIVPLSNSSASIACAEINGFRVLALLPGRYLSGDIPRLDDSRRGGIPVRRLLTSTAFFAAICLVAAFACGADTAPLHWETNSDKAWKDTVASGRMLLVYITTDGCIHCKRMERDTLANAEVTAQIRQGFVAAKVQAQDQPALIERLGVRLYPAMIIFAPDSQVVDVIGGYQTPQEMRTRLAAASQKKKM